MTLNMEEKTCCENTTGQKNLWSENCLKKQLDVERLTLNMEEKTSYEYTQRAKKKPLVIKLLSISIKINMTVHR